MMPEPEVYCGKCNWEGSTSELGGETLGSWCPSCKEGKYIEDCEPEYDYDNELHGGSFNWNKK